VSLHLKATIENKTTSVTTHFKKLTTGNTGRPPYLSDLLHYHEPIRSYSSHELSVPRHNLSFGSCAFRFSAPRVWNSLPVSIRESHSVPTFRRNLKTFYFQSDYPISAAHLAYEYLCPCALILLRLRRYINHVLT